MPLPGDKIRLVYQAPLDKSDLHVRATLRMPDDSILGVPVTLVYVGNGLYTNNAIVFPDTSVIKSSIEIFKDAGFALPYWRRFRSAIQLIKRAAEQQVKLAGIVTAPISAKIQESQASASFQDDRASVEIRDDEISAETQSDTIKTDQRDNQLKVGVNCE